MWSSRGEDAFQRAEEYANMVKHLQHHPPEGLDDLDETMKTPRQVLQALCEDGQAADTHLAHRALKLLGYFVALKPFSTICGEDEVDFVLRALVSLALTTDRKSILNLAVWCLSMQTFDAGKVKKVFPSIIEALVYGINNPFNSGTASLESLKAVERLMGSMPEIMCDHHVWIMPAACLLFEDDEEVCKKALDCLQCAVRAFGDAGPPTELSKCLADCITNKNIIAAMEFSIGRASTSAAHAVQVWSAFILLSGCMLESTYYVNKMLKVLEKCFGSKDTVLYAEAFQAWQSFVIGLARQRMLSSRKHLSLLTQPILLGLKSSRKVINQAAFQCWIHLVHRLDGFLLESPVFALAVLPVLDILENASSLSSALGNFSNTVCKSRDSSVGLQRASATQNKIAAELGNGEGCIDGAVNDVLTQVLRHTKRLLSMPGAACPENMNDLLEFLESSHVQPLVELIPNAREDVPSHKGGMLPQHTAIEYPTPAVDTRENVSWPSSRPNEAEDIGEMAAHDKRQVMSTQRCTLQENQPISQSLKAAQQDQSFNSWSKTCNKRRKSVHFEESPNEEPPNYCQTQRETLNTQDGAFAMVDLSRGDACAKDVADTKPFSNCLCKEMEFCEEPIGLLFTHTDLPPQCKELVHNWGLQEIGQLASCPSHLIDGELLKHFHNALAHFSKSCKCSHSRSLARNQLPPPSQSRKGGILDSLCSVLDAPVWQNLDKSSLLLALGYTSHFQTKICEILQEEGT